MKVLVWVAVFLIALIGVGLGSAYEISGSISLNLDQIVLMGIIVIPVVGFGTLMAVVK